MTTVPQTTCSAQHTVAFDQALRDARTQLPRRADATRADRGLMLAESGAVTLEHDTIALVRSGRDAEVIYRVHSRGGCDCPDSVRRRAALPAAAPGVVGCKHWYAAALVGMAHLTLACNGYRPQAEPVWYPAVYQGESGCAWSGHATETTESGWWFEFGDSEGGLYCSIRDLEIWNREPVHHIAWRETVRQWESWLQGR